MHILRIIDYCSNPIILKFTADAVKSIGQRDPCAGVDASAEEAVRDSKITLRLDMNPQIAALKERPVYMVFIACRCEKIFAAAANFAACYQALKGKGEENALVGVSGGAILHHALINCPQVNALGASVSTASGNETVFTFGDIYSKYPRIVSGAALQATICAIGQLNADGRKGCIFNDGHQLFRNRGDDIVYANLNKDSLIHVQEDGIDRLVVGQYSEYLGLTIYVSQDMSIYNRQAHETAKNYAIVAAAILAVTLLIVAVCSLVLTRSIRLLTRRIKHLPVDSMLAHSDEALTTTVTSPRDQDIHKLESTLNRLMTKTRSATMGEMAMQEGAWQARMNAL